MADDALVNKALAMLKANQDYQADAREGSLVNNSVIGSVLALTTGSPRQYCEAAVREALRQLKRPRR